MTRYRADRAPQRMFALALAAAAMVLPAHASAAAGSTDQASATAAHVPGEILVKYRPGTAAAARAARAARAAGDPSAAELPRTIRTRGPIGPKLRALRARSDVAYAVPNYIAHAAGSGTGTTPAFPVFDDPGRSGIAGGWSKLQWNLDGTFGVDAPGAWRNVAAAGRPGGSGVVVAVLDTGVAYRNHGRFRRSPDLARARFVAGRDLVARTRFPYDRDGHGTHVASTIAETADNGVGVVGLAYQARIMPVRILNSHGDGDGATIARGIRWAAEHGAQIINLSLEFPLDVTGRDIPEILSALRYAGHHRVLVVAAAGNEGRGAVAYPARSRHAFAVGATTADGCVADYSNEGRELDVVAPGGGDDAALRGDPYCHPGVRGPDIVQMTFRHEGSPRRFGLPGGYEGTSMATPHVSATAALVIASGALGSHPTPAAIERRLERTAYDLGAPGRDKRFGAGLIDAAAATAPGRAARPTAPAPPG